MTTNKKRWHIYQDSYGWHLRTLTGWNTYRSVDHFIPSPDPCDPRMVSRNTPNWDSREQILEYIKSIEAYEAASAERAKVVHEEYL